MNIYKFSLSEGCDLKLSTYGAESYVGVTYRGQQLLTLGEFILGEAITVRRGILGSSFVVSSPDPVTHIDLVDRIRRRVRENSTTYEDLANNLKHLEGFSVNETTGYMIRQQAQMAFDRTRERMRSERTQAMYYQEAVEASRHRIHGTLVDTSPWSDEMAFTPQAMPLPTRGVIRVGGRDYVVHSGTVYREDTGGQVQINEHGYAVNINSVGE